MASSRDKSKGKSPSKAKRASRPSRRDERGEDRVAFAVIGQGHFAQMSILPAFAGAKNCELRAIFSEDETKLRALKRKYGVETALGYDHFEEYLSSGAVDAVYVALPNDLHYEYVVRAARARVHVLCEKPLAMSSAEAERMIAACDDNGVKLMVGYRLHFEGANLAALEAIDSRRLGDPRFFASTFSMQIRPNNIRTQRARGGGPLHDIGIYCVNAARALFRAEPIEAVALSASARGDERFTQIDEQVSAVLRFPHDRLAQFTCGFGAFAHSSYSVVCTDGRLRMDPAYNMAVDLVVETETPGEKPRRQTFKKRDQVAPELIEFASCIREGREPEASGREGLADIRVMEAIEESLGSGRRVSVRGGAEGRHPSPEPGSAPRVPLPSKPDLVNVDPPRDD